MSRVIKTVPGIGDTIWLIMKLINQPERFHWKIGDGSPQRGHQIFELFPQLTESFEYVPDMGYKKVKRNSYSGSWATAPQEMYLEANSHLEGGRRIENFLPDLPTSFILPYATTKEDAAKACYLTDEKKENYLFDANFKHIGIYTTSYGNARYMSGWLDDQWLELINLILRHSPTYKFVFIGAPYDVGVSQNVMARMKPEQYINAIGQSLPVTIEILKRLEMFIGFQSGLSIINETIGAKQTIMLYAQALEEMIDTWPDPERIKSGAYKGCTFGTSKHPLTPDQLFGWLKENNKL